ncbi:hypothetical protein [Sinorhizobium sp. BG8]|uniref:hypothetical protein n=1 Tax=Sinorhizobium sp. BG8 TaxID=2613773 RepID=UPI00193C8A5B|nr:hypothetical protein [Sinorhizobium sp. BG8]QRM55031.1 hypothetical protein F3Y30_11125 [Sinorhizobium sp. BG8]
MVTSTVTIDHIRLGDRPLVVCDVDEVVLEFLTPFREFLNSRGHDLLPRSFRLHGNIVGLIDGTITDNAVISALQEDFFADQEAWQRPALQAVETLTMLGKDADVVFLTAMPPRHEATRRRLLDRVGLTFPMVATEEEKGPVVRALHRQRSLPAVFIDDISRNLESVRAHAPDTLLLHLMANAEFRAMAPALGDGVVSATDWTHAASLIRAHWMPIAGR